MRNIVLSLMGLLTFLNLTGQNVEKQYVKGFIDFNLYYDTRDFNVMTINILTKLSSRFQYFSLTNYIGVDESLDLASFYTEQNLRWQIKESSPLDLTLQYVIRQGKGNDHFRFGVRWRISDTQKLNGFFKKWNMSYSANPMVFQFKTNTKTKFMTQIEHVYRIRIYKDHIYLGGFADQNFVYDNGKASFKWVTEHQLGTRLFDQFYAVAEFRINDFLESDNTGLGIGFEYVIRF